MFTRTFSVSRDRMSPTWQILLGRNLRHVFQIIIEVWFLDISKMSWATFQLTNNNNSYYSSVSFVLLWNIGDLPRFHAKAAEPQTRLFWDNRFDWYSSWCRDQINVPLFTTQSKVRFHIIVNIFWWFECFNYFFFVQIIDADLEEIFLGWPPVDFQTTDIQFLVQMM